MTLTAMPGSPIDGVQYDPDYISEDFLQTLLAPPEAPEIPLEAEIPMPSGVLTAPYAMAAVREMFLDPDFLPDEFGAAAEQDGISREALWAELEAEVAEAPPMAPVPPEVIARAESNMALLRVETTPEGATLFIDGEARLTIPLTTARGASAAYKMQCIIVGVDVVLLLLAIFHASEGPDKKFARTIGKDISTSNLKKVTLVADASLKEFGTVMEIFSAAKAAKKSLIDAAMDAHKPFCSAFATLVKLIANACKRMAIWVTAEYFGNWKRALKTIGRALLWALESLGNPVLALAHTIIDLIVAALAVIIDVETLKATPK